MRKVLSSVVYLVQWMRLMMICCGMAVKMMEMSGGSVKEEGTDCEDRDNDTLTGKFG
jgi:hypothetical protein